MNKGYIALGTNIEPRYDYLSKALKMLANEHCITIVNKSSIYETTPVGYTNQAHFLNMVVEVDTTYSSLELLEVCQTIELVLGRKREIRFGPRTIDLDILVYNNENRETERLILPHPRMHERAFVLVPLIEIAPELIIGTDKIKEYLKHLSEEDKRGVYKWKESEKQVRDK